MRPRWAGVRWLTVLVFFQVSVSCLAEKPAARDSAGLLAGSPYRDATFTFSSDPDKLLVFVSSIGMSNLQRTVGLYGDGRIVFKKSRRGKLLEEQVVEIEPVEIERILRTAVDFGLAEWDMTRVQSKQLEMNDGKLYTGVPSDAPREIVLISLDQYERGEYRLPHLERKIRFQGAAFADRMYPSILEIRGILELKRALRHFKPEVEP